MADNSINQAVSAVKRNDLQFLKEWINSGNNPNQYDDGGWTPLLVACVRGYANIVDFLLNNEKNPANPDMEHKISKGLGIHFAGHSGSREAAELILQKSPKQMEAIWFINGHTFLLQAAFYGHLELTKYALERGGSTAATTVRGLAAMEFAKQFKNKPLQDIIAPYDSPKEKKDEYYKMLLNMIAPQIPENEKAEQELADQLNSILNDGLMKVADNPSVIDETINHIKDYIENKKVNVNRLAGPLSQPPLIVVVTGINGDPVNNNIKTYREKTAELLLEYGADPVLKEIHPMGVDAIIRASVFNHLNILKMMGRKLTKEALADALNESPIVNGLTGLHDTVLRGSMVGPELINGYLEQIRWYIENGGRYDIEDFTGRTQQDIAENIKDPAAKEKIMKALNLIQ